MKGKQEGDDLFDRLSVSTIFINHLVITTIDSFRIIGQKVIINNRQIDVSCSERWQKCANEIGHFRVAVNLTMKARLSAELFI